MKGTAKHNKNRQTAKNPLLNFNVIRSYCPPIFTDTDKVMVIDRSNFVLFGE